MGIIMFWFAWVGSSPLPAFTITTVGDVWGGSQKYLGSTWNGRLNTTGNILNTKFENQNGQSITLQDTDGLIEGKKYGINGPGITSSTITSSPFLTDTRTGS